MTALERDHPIFNGHSLAAAEKAYRWFGGKQESVLRGFDPFVRDAETRLHHLMAGCRLTPQELPVFATTTGSPNARVFHHSLDNSYALALDGALLAWISQMATLSVANRATGGSLEALARAILYTFDIFIAQRHPEHENFSWKHVGSATVESLRAAFYFRRYHSVILPLSMAWADFALAHELAHIELKHMDSNWSMMVPNVLDRGRSTVSLFPGRVDLELDADKWALERVATASSVRTIESFDKALIRMWGLREAAARVAWPHVVRTSVRLFFTMCNLLEDLLPKKTFETHPSPTTRLNALGLTDSFHGPTTIEFPKHWNDAEAAYSRLAELKASPTWTRLLHSRVR